MDNMASSVPRPLPRSGPRALYNKSKWVRTSSKYTQYKTRQDLIRWGERKLYKGLVANDRQA